MEPTDSPSIRALAVSALFFVFLLFNLCLPEPQGPADNGDFPRNFSDFSDGPRGYAYFPSATDPTYGERRSSGRSTSTSRTFSSTSTSFSGSAVSAQRW